MLFIRNDLFRIRLNIFRVRSYPSYPFYLSILDILKQNLIINQREESTTFYFTLYSTTVQNPGKSSGSDRIRIHNTDKKLYLPIQGAEGADMLELKLTKLDGSNSNLEPIRNSRSSDGKIMNL